jgi:hypothetical protein
MTLGGLLLGPLIGTVPERGRYAETRHGENHRYCGPADELAALNET